MEHLFIALLLSCGVLALTGRWVARRASLVAAIDRFDAVQVFAGMALFALALWTWLRVGIVTLFELVKYWPAGGIALVSAVLSGIVLGTLFGLPRDKPRPRTPWYWQIAGGLAIYAAVMLIRFTYLK